MVLRGLTVPGGGGGAITHAGDNTLGMSNLGNTAGTSGVIMGTALQYLFAGGANITLSQSINADSATLSIVGANQNVTAANGGFAFQTLSFSNAQGVSFATSAGGAIVASVETSYAASNHSHGNPTLFLTNLSGTTASNSAGLTLSLSAGAGGAGDGGNILAAGTRTAHSTATVLFSNANGISFGLNAVTGSIMTASHNALTTARASNDAIGLNTAQSNVTWTVDSSGLSLDARGYAGTGTSATNASITLNSNGLAISVAAPGGGGGINRSFTEICAMERTALVFNVTATQFTKRPIFQPFWLDGSNLSVNTVRLLISRAAGTSLNCTIGVGFYSMANSTSLAMVSSTTNAYSLTTSALWSGIRFLDITGLSNLTLSEGRWVLAFYFSASNNSSAVMQFSVFGADPAPNFIGFLSAGTNVSSATHATSGGFVPFWGVYSNTTAAFPANVAKSEMSMSGSAAMPEMWAGIFEVS